MSGDSGTLLVILMFVGTCVILLLVLGGIIFFVSRSGKAVNRAWGELATRTGLTFKPPAMFSWPEMNGTFRGRPMRVYIYSSGTQRNRQTYTAVALTVKNSGNSSLEITPSGTLGNFFGKMVKAQDVQIGNAELDARFVIKSYPPEFASKILGSVAAQTGIMALPGVGRIEMEGQSLKYSRRGLEEDPELLTKVFNTLSDLAEAIER